MVWTWSASATWPGPDTPDGAPPLWGAPPLPPEGGGGGAPRMGGPPPLGPPPLGPAPRGGRGGIGKEFYGKRRKGKRKRKRVRSWHCEGGDESRCEDVAGVEIDLDWSRVVAALMVNGLDGGGELNGKLEAGRRKKIIKPAVEGENGRL
jgi:hypothetical protein